MKNSLILASEIKNQLILKPTFNGVSVIFGRNSQFRSMQFQELQILPTTVKLSLDANGSQQLNRGMEMNAEINGTFYSNTNQSQRVIWWAGQHRKFGFVLCCSRDSMQGLTLKFDSKEAAVNFAQKNGKITWCNW